MASVIKLPVGVHLSIRAFAEEAGLDRDTVKKRIHAAGLNASCKRGGYPVYRLKDLLSAASAGTFDGEFDPDRLRPFERHAFYKSEREKLQLQVERGELLSSLEVEQRYAALFKVVAEALDTLPDVLERDCGASPLQLTKIEQRLDTMRDDLYSRLTESTDQPASVEEPASGDG